MAEANLANLMKSIGHHFGDQRLLLLALSHRSVGQENNERLEFLGDAILNLVIASALFEQFPQAQEGQLSRLRAKLVQRDTLAELAKVLNLSDALLLGAGEMKTGGAQRSSILADAFEALLGAIYLDAGMDVCQARILYFYRDLLAKLTLESNYKDPKTRLQEFLQAKRLPLPEYDLLATDGEEHSQIFIIRCRCALLPEGREGRGSSRRKAEQTAARAVLGVVQSGK